MTRIHLMGSPLVVAIVLLAASCGSSGASACGSLRTDKVVKIGSHKFDAQVVDTEAGLEKGLSGRRCIGADQAMLFVFKEPGVYQFGMKDMRFPIDMVWLDAGRDVVWLEENVSPSTYPAAFLNRAGAAKYAVELKAGTAKEVGLKMGSQVSF